MKKNSLSTLFIFVLLTGLLLGACGTSPTASPTTEPVETVEAVEQPTETLEATTEPEPTGEPQPKELELEDGLGRTVSIPQPVEHIISLAPSNTEILFTVGAGDQVIGRDSFSDYPEEALDVTDIGGGFSDLDTETILTLEADLILAAELTAPEQIQTLEDLGLTVFVVPNPTTIEEMYDNLRLVAKITGHEANANTLIEDLQARVAAVEEKVADVEEKPLVFYELDGTDPNAPWTAGPGTFIDALLTRAGGANVGSSLDGAWVQINLEELIAQDPDIILLGDYLYGGITPEDVAARAGWDGLSAVKNEQVYTFNDNLVSRPGPRLVEGLETLAELLHPEAFE